MRPRTPKKYRHNPEEKSKWKGRWRQALRHKRIAKSDKKISVSTGLFVVIIEPHLPSLL